MEEEVIKIKDAGIKLLANLSSYDTHELLEDLLNHYDKMGLVEITEEEILEYLKIKLNIL